MKRPDLRQAKDLERLRGLTGLSEAEAAAVIGVSRQAYGLREQGMRVVRPEE